MPEIGVTTRVHCVVEMKVIRDLPCYLLARVNVCFVCETRGSQQHSVLTG